MSIHSSPDLELCSSFSTSDPVTNYDYAIKYIPIYKAAIEDDWEAAKKIFEKENVKLNAYITVWETTLHIAVGTNSSHRFVEELVNQIMTVGNVDDQQRLEMLETRSLYGNNALHYAAKAGNTTATRLLISKNPEMTQIVNGFGETALKLAAWYGRKETLCYLMKVTKNIPGENKSPSPFQGHDGADLFTFSITAGFYDVALYLVQKYPDLVTAKNRYNKQTGLQTLAAKPHAFPSGIKLGFWQNIICSWIPVNREKALKSPIEIKDDAQVTTTGGIRETSKAIPSISENYGENARFWIALQYFAPGIKQIHDMKVRHIQAEALVKQMCEIVIKKGEHNLAWDVMGSALSTAVTHGIHELIEECIRSYPSLVWYDVGGFYLFLAAIKQRQEKVYNLVYQMSSHKVYAATENINGENALHFAAKLAPPHRLNTVTGAALQMQRELQWFKEVEKFVEPSYKEALNKDNNTPRMVFTNEHKDLIKEAQKWMKDTSSSATVVAALIVTIAFGVMFTVPGGNNDDGKPLFLNDAIFILFAISDAIALFSSSTSVLMFLSILNSRYAEEDFLYALPKTLTIGLISLFVSLAATMVAFSATLSLVLRDEIRWIAGPVTLLAMVPVTLFLLLQYPLLVELVRSTYGRGIFYKQNSLLLH